MKHYFRLWRRSIRAKILFAVLKLLSFHSYFLLYCYAKILSYLCCRIPNTLHKTVRLNIELCFPEYDKKSQKKLIESAIYNNICAILELGKLWFNTPSTLLQSIDEREGETEFLHDLNQQNGMILLSPHFGAWELAGLYCAELNHKMTIMYRPSRLGLDAIMKKARQRFDAHVVPANQSGVRAMLKALQQKQTIGLLPDQDPGLGEGIFAPFFGINTMTMVLVSRLAQKYTVPVYLITARRKIKAGKFAIQCKKLDANIYDPNLLTSVTSLNQNLETVIRHHPEQYLWAYPRFKSVPENELQAYLHGKNKE